MEGDKLPMSHIQLQYISGDGPFESYIKHAVTLGILSAKWTWLPTNICTFWSQCLHLTQQFLSLIAFYIPKWLLATLHMSAGQQDQRGAETKPCCASVSQSPQFCPSSITRVFKDRRWRFALTGLKNQRNSLKL